MLAIKNSPAGELSLCFSLWLSFIFCMAVCLSPSGSLSLSLVLSLPLALFLSLSGCPSLWLALYFCPPITRRDMLAIKNSPAGANSHRCTPPPVFGPLCLPLWLSLSFLPARYLVGSLFLCLWLSLSLFLSLSLIPSFLAAFAPVGLLKDTDSLFFQLPIDRKLGIHATFEDTAQRQG